MTGNGLFIGQPEKLLRDRVTDAMREAILRGDLAPGRHLTERELGEMTGVSRTSLREALRSLQAEGLVERSEARGVRVALLTESRVGELYDVRAILEPAAAELFVEHASDEQVAALMASLPSGGPDPEEQLAATRAFYAVLLEGTGNTVLQEIFRSVEARVHAQRRLSLRSGGRADASRAEMAEMAARIRERDAAGAAASARAHVVAAKAAAMSAIRIAEP